MRGSPFLPASASRRAAALALALLFSSMCGSDPNPVSPSGPNIDGVYALRLETSCDAVPQDQRTREYIATITGSPNATLTLSNATFWQHPTEGLYNKLSVVQRGKSLTINTQRPPVVIERTGPTTYLSFTGFGSGDINGLGVLGAITGSLQGPVKFGEDLQNPSRHRQCAATSGLVTLRLTHTNRPAEPPGVAPSIASAEITGPSTVAPGTSAQFGIVARMTDGSTREVTDGLSWHSTNAPVLSAENNGVLVGGRSGEAIVQATVTRTNVTSLLVERAVIVVPDGTFRVIGQVTEEGATVPVAGARVEVVSASPAVSTTTDFQGRYRLYGVRPGADIRITRDNYEPRILQVSAAEHQTLNTTLRLSQPRPDVSGTYTLTITAACQSGSLPQALQERKYTATISQTGPTLFVTLSGATFHSGASKTFSGQIAGSTATFTLQTYGYYSYSSPSLIEQLPESVLVVTGQATTTISSNSIVGRLSGYISQMTSYPGTSITGCYSTAHNFALTR
jgi:carboxypeptidase family protein